MTATHAGPSAGAEDARRAFEAASGFALDGFQLEALDALDAGRSVLVAAPTGSGKTLVAEYAIAKALATGTKAFYTTPLKALSNQKYSDLVRVHGRDRVGLLTGDNAINGNAPIVVMTTEVLRNMIYAGSDTLSGLRYVVLDEVHYLQNRYRGAVWEEVIVHLPPTVDLVCLSATVSNAEEFADWLRTVRGDATVVIEERRPVELTHQYLVGERGSDSLVLLPTFVGSGDDEPRANPDAVRLDSRGWRDRSGRTRSRLRTPGRVETVERLAAEGMLPAIVFVFSRAGCDAAVEQCLAAGIRLTKSDERHQIRSIAERCVSGLTSDDLDVLRYDTWLAGLEGGVAAHHAGMVPPMKEAVEEAFAAGLVKVVYATETLSLGINMPARSVVIEKLSKFTGERHEFLTPGEYTQLTGRAGRRGIDALGYAVVSWSPFVPFDQVAGLASRRTYALTSSFRPTFNMAANLVRRYPADVAHHLLNLSFAQYRIDRDVVALERQLERTRELLERQRELAAVGGGDLAGYRALLAQVDALQRSDGRDRRVDLALDALRPGDVLEVGRKGGRVAVLRHDAGRGGNRVMALSASRELLRLGPADFDSPPEVVGRVELPQPFAPRSGAFRRTVADALRRLPDSGRRGRSGKGGAKRVAADPMADAQDALAAHPLHKTPGLDQRLRAAVAVDRLGREADRIERRVRGRTESLARQFDRVLRVLGAWGYVDGWTLTPAGALLADLYTETDLLVAETLKRGLLDGLAPAETAALVSTFTFEARGPDAQRVVPRFPTSRVAQRFRDIERIARDLAVDESGAGLPETRHPDAGLTEAVYAWVKGEDLGEVLGDEELTGGDFVRNVKQIVDLLRQIADVAPVPATAATARDAADACFRGVVAASSVVRA